LECSPEYSDVTIKPRKGGTHRVETGRTFIREAVKNGLSLGASGLLLEVLVDDEP